MWAMAVEAYDHTEGTDADEASHNCEADDADHVNPPAEPVEIGADDHEDPDVYEDSHDKLLERQS